MLRTDGKKGLREISERAGRDDQKRHSAAVGRRLFPFP